MSTDTDLCEETARAHDPQDAARTAERKRGRITEALERDRAVRRRPVRRALERLARALVARSAAPAPFTVGWPDEATDRALVAAGARLRCVVGDALRAERGGSVREGLITDGVEAAIESHANCSAAKAAYWAREAEIAATEW